MSLGAGGAYEELTIAVAAVGVPEASEQFDVLSGSLDKLAASADRAAVSLDATAGGETAAGAGSRKGGLMGALGGFKTLAAGFGIYEAIKQFSNFQSSMELVHTQAGATQREVGSLSAGILNMAPHLATSPQGLSESLYHIISTGERGANAMKTMEVAAKGAQIGMAGIVPTTNALTSVMVTLGNNSKFAASSMGMLNAIVGSGDMKMEDLNSALSTGILRTAKQLGIGLKGVGAALDVLGDNNIRGAAAANRFRMGLTDIMHPSTAATEALAKLGLQPMKLAESLQKTGLMGMLKELKSHLGNIFAGDAGKGVGAYEKTMENYDLSPIFGSGRNSAGMLILANEMDRLHEKYKLIEAGANNFNQDWKKTTETLRFFIGEVKALIDDGLIKLGSVLNSVVVHALQPFLKWITGGSTVAGMFRTALIALAGAFVTYKLAVWGAALAMSVFAADVDIATIISLAAGVQSLGDAFVFLDLVMDANPFVLIGMAVIALTAGIVYLVVKVKAIREGFVSVFNWVKGHWKLLLPILTGPFGLAIDAIVTHYHKIKKGAEWVFSELKKIFHEVTSVLEKPFYAVWHVVQHVAHLMVGAFKWAVKEIKKLWHEIAGPFEAVAHFFEHIGGGIGHAFSKAFGIPGFAEGGMVNHGGAYLVGERGPEVVYMPGGSQVIPNHQLGGLGMGDVQVVVPVYLDSKQVAKGIMKVGMNAQAVA